MALYHLSGDEGKKKKSGKTKKKKVAKLAIAPVRGAMLTVTELNLLKTGTKLARVWKAEDGKGKAALTKWWTESFKGDIGHLKKAIAKGSKQTISGSQMGIIADATIATATAALIAVAPIIKAFKGQGDAKEAAEFDKGIEQGKKDLAKDPDVEKGTADMPEDADVARLKSKDKKKKAKDDTTALGLNTNPISICFFLPMLILSMNLKNPFLLFIASILSLYSVIGLILIPFCEFAIAGYRVQKVTRKYFDIPASWFFSVVNLFSATYNRFILKSK